MANPLDYPRDDIPALRRPESGEFIHADIPLYCFNDLLRSPNINRLLTGVTLNGIDIVSEVAPLR